MDINNLTSGIDLDNAGQEGEATGGGGGGKFSRVVPSGWYQVCLNRFATFGKITGMQSTGNGQSELRTTDLMRIGFEIMQMIKPLDPNDAGFECVKEFKNDDGTVDKVPYDIDMNGMFGVKRSHHEAAILPHIIEALQENLPNDVYAKAVETHGTVQARYPTIKSMFGQQYIVYIQKFEKNGNERNEVLFNKGKAEDFTKLNSTSGTPKSVSKGIEVYSIDEGKPKLGIKPVETGTPIHSRAILFDVGAEDMTQANFDSVAQESIYIGRDALAGHGDMVRYCTLVNLYSKLGKYRDTALGKLLQTGAIVIPEPTPYKEKTKEESNQEEYSSPLNDVAVATTDNTAGDEEFQV